ncbi:arginine--tRNA ligase, partial [Candidatus Micrarchaeota archaeon]|nr:arginine--tRNA ligase [Candidatus Micrarchaeota archaeon]
ASFSRIDAQGPYVNFYFSDKFYAEALKKMLKEKGKFGKGKKTGKEIMVEYFHANTHKGAHIGHIRNISLGEAVARLLEFSGNKIIRANYQGDIGPHVAKCLWGFINLYHEKAPDENRGVWLGKVYAEASNRIKDNPELEAQAKEINLKLYAGDKRIKEIWKKTRQWCLDDFEKFYKEFGVKFDELYFESQTEGIGKEISLDLLKRGIAKKDQGAVIMDLKDEDLGVAVLLTTEGYSVYHAKDLGLAKLKFDKYKNLDRSIHVVGKEQELYFKQLFRIFEKAGMKKAAEISYHLIYELVMLPEGKMSSREGTMVLYEDLKEKLLEIVNHEVRKRHAGWDDKKTGEIARKIAFAALKFSMVRREHNRTIVFDWDQALSLEGDSGPYLQYAYVRTLGILKKATFKPKIGSSYAYTEDEKKLIKRMYALPGAAGAAADSLSPHVLCDYLLDLATELNRFYTTSRVLNAEKEEERETRLAIVAATNLVIGSALSLLGIEAPEAM